MDDLEFMKRATEVINETTKELKAANDREKERRKPCRCEAYPFPHRKYGGKCEAYDPEAGDEEAADRWLMGLMERGYRNIDEKLDDPRRGQAESINRERKP